MNVEKQPYLAGGCDCALKHEDEVLGLLTLPRFRCGNAIHDEDGGGFENGVHDAKTIGSQRRAGFRDFDDGIGKLRDFDFRCAPGKFDARFYGVACEIFFRDLHDFCGDRFAFEVADIAHRGVFWNGKDPPDASEALLGVDEFGKFIDGCAGFDDPIVASNSRVESAGFDVACHFLRPDHQAFDFRVINGWDVTARTERDFPACASKELERRDL